MAIDLVDRIRDAVLRQQEEWMTNYLTCIEDNREFITDRTPTAGVELTLKLICYSSERLTADNGNRVVLVYYPAHLEFEDVSKDLPNLNDVNRKPFIA
ncbi:Hypothetical protein PHPALM_17110 [Phytophthora palmivora]|uniref:Uncharacterized protein n=1 Tax=Phytophthora palmivora TaxID=4796 RepID=A0A2P4XN32_9STRA|nr:Hypothetical protein PHPALM_17110 [Phytophthora palmivora]